MSVAQPDLLTRMPQDLQLYTLQFLETVEPAWTSGVSKNWRLICSKDALWKVLLLKRFPHLQKSVLTEGAKRPTLLATSMATTSVASTAVNREAASSSVNFKQLYENCLKAAKILGRPELTRAPDNIKRTLAANGTRNGNWEVIFGIWKSILGYQLFNIPLIPETDVVALLAAHGVNLIAPQQPAKRPTKEELEKIASERIATVRAIISKATTDAKSAGPTAEDTRKFFTAFQLDYSHIDPDHHIDSYIITPIALADLPLFASIAEETQMMVAAQEEGEQRYSAAQAAKRRWLIGKYALGAISVVVAAYFARSYFGFGK